MFPDIYVCPECAHEFIVREATPGSIHCPSCSHYMGERRFTTVLETEIEELIGRLSIERDRLEEDEAVYGAGEHPPELLVYGENVHRILAILRRAIADLEALRISYR